MFVSILQRLGVRVSQHPGEPLQSRADSNTRKSRSGGQGQKVRKQPAQPGVSIRVLPKLIPRGDTT